MRLLMETISQLLEEHEGLLALAREKQEVVIKGDVKELSRLLEEESRLVKRIGTLEKERQFQVEEALKRHNLSTASEQPTLEELLTQVPSRSEKENIITLAHKLGDVIKDLQQQNELNMRLIQDALAAVNHSLALFTQVEEEVTYRKPDQQGKPVPPSSGGGLFDTKA